MVSEKVPFWGLTYPLCERSPLVTPGFGFLSSEKVVSPADIFYEAFLVW